MTPQQYRLLRTALTLAGHGHPVFPCVLDQKRPLTRHGLHDATTDAETIRTWWRKHPDANIGMPTGTASFDVLDIDIRATGSGFPALNRLLRERMLTGRNQVVRTPSNGLHIYFAGTDQPSGSIPTQHLDFKATGGYVLVPPSVVGGRPYEAVTQSTGTPGRLDWSAVRDLLAPTSSTSTELLPARRPNQGIEPLAAWVSRLPEGRRNSGTFWAACRALEQGIIDLRPILDAATTAGLPRAEAARTIGSAIRRITEPTTAAPAPTRAAPRSRTGT